MGVVPGNFANSRALLNPCVNVLRGLHERKGYIPHIGVGAAARRLRAGGPSRGGGAGYAGRGDGPALHFSAAHRRRRGLPERGRERRRQGHAPHRRACARLRRGDGRLGPRRAHNHRRPELQRGAAQPRGPGRNPRGDRGGRGAGLRYPGKSRPGQLAGGPLRGGYGDACRERRRGGVPGNLPGLRL